MTTAASPVFHGGGLPLVLSPEDRARVEEIEELARAGAESVDELLALLDEPSWAVRRAVVSALAALGDPAVPGLVDIVAHRRDNESRLAAAVEALVASRAAVEPKMMELARTATSPLVVCDAVNVLGRRRSREALPLFDELSKHGDDNVAVAAIEALGRIGGPETVDALVSAVESRHFFRRFPAIDALGRTGDFRAVEPLTALLGDPLYAPEAARGLGHTGSEAAVAPLARLLSSPSDALVRTAAVALAELRERYEARFGDTPTIARALPEAISPAKASARIIASLPGVAPSELVAIARVLAWLGDGASIEQLIELVMHDGPVGAAATDALRRVGPRAMPHLLSRIRGGDSAWRLRLLPIVGYTREHIDVLIECLHDPDPEVRARACEAVARAGDPVAVAPLFALLGDNDARVSQAASMAIQALGSLETKRLALEQACSADSRTRRAALRIIAYFGYPEGLLLLVDALSEEDEKVREAAILGLPQIGDPRGTAALLDTAKHPSARTRAAVMRALGSTQPAPSVLAALRVGLSDEDAWVRYYACQALGKLRAAEAEDDIADRIEDPSGQVRVAAVEALALLPGERAAKALERAAQSSDADLKRAALVGLGVARRAGAIPILREAAGSDDPTTRLVAIGALAELDGPDVVPTLAHAASDPDESVRSAAISHLAMRVDPEATAVLIERLLDPNTRERAIEALTVAADERVEGVLAALKTADDDEAPVLVSALTRMRRPSSHAAIAAALAFDNVHARRAAVAALAAIGTTEARAAVERAASDPDPVVRRLAIAAASGW
jgi:HEAT repeat protein